MRPGGVVDVRAGWRRTGIRAAEGLGARELGPGLQMDLEKQLTSHLGDSGIARRPTSCNKHGATPTREKLAFIVHVY